MNFPKQLSIVIPIFNEQARIKNALKTCRKYQAVNPQWEFILVNDGSSDKSLKLIKQSEFRVVSYKTNQGKGFALKQGVRKAKRPYTLICDVDFSTPLSEVDLLFPFIKKGSDMVIGSRKVVGAKVIKHQPKFRECLGKQFTNLSKLWLGLKVSDVTCGFKLFKTPVAKKLFELSKIKRWGYDAEVLFLVKNLKYKVAEVAVSWKNDERTKVSLAKDIYRSLMELLLIRFYDFTGFYKNNRR